MAKPPDKKKKTPAQNQAQNSANLAAYATGFQNQVQNQAQNSANLAAYATSWAEAHPEPVSAPTPPPPPPPKPKPELDAAYYSAIDIANKREEQGHSDLNDRERTTRFDFGIDDPTNPNSRMAGLKRAYLASGKRASVSIASRKLLYSGTHERAMGRNVRKENAANAALRSSYEEALKAIGRDRATNTTNAEEARNQAFEEWLGRIPDPEAVDFSPPPTAAAAAAAAPADKVKVVPKPKPKAKPKPSSGPNTNKGSGQYKPPKKKKKG